MHILLFFILIALIFPGLVRFIMSLVGLAVLCVIIVAAANSSQSPQIHKVCLSTAHGHHSYEPAACGKDIGGNHYACVFPDGTSATCFKDGNCFVCAGMD